MKSCKKFRRLWLDARLDGKQIPDTNGHLTECRACRTWVEDTDRLMEVLHSKKAEYQSLSFKEADVTSIVHKPEGFSTYRPVLRYVAVIFILVCGFLFYRYMAEDHKPAGQYEVNVVPTLRGIVQTPGRPPIPDLRPSVHSVSVIPPINLTDVGVRIHQIRTQYDPSFTKIISHFKSS